MQTRSCLGPGIKGRNGLQRGMWNFLAVIEMFCIFIVVMVSQMFITVMLINLYTLNAYGFLYIKYS